MNESFQDEIVITGGPEGCLKEEAIVIEQRFVAYRNLSNKASQKLASSRSEFEIGRARAYEYRQHGWTGTNSRIWEQDLANGMYSHRSTAVSSFLTFTASGKICFESYAR